MSYYFSYAPPTYSCTAYCNASGYYANGFSCGESYCCGTISTRYCCSNSSLDITGDFQERCRCPMSSCSYLSWDVLLPSIAAAAFCFIMITICVCQACKHSDRCRRCCRCPSNAEHSSNDNPSRALNLEEGQGPGNNPAFPQPPPYQFGPPKYETLELVESPPKYEEVISQRTPDAGQENSAFVSSPDCDQPPDIVIPRSDCQQETSPTSCQIPSHQAPAILESQSQSFCPPLTSATQAPEPSVCLPNVMELTSASNEGRLETDRKERSETTA